MLFRDHYDWVVLGDHPGALLSANLAARLGLSVLILPLAPGVKLSVAKNGQVLDPEPNFLLGLAEIGGAPGLLGKCLDRLGILPVEKERILTEDVLPQILTPSRRVCFTRDPARLQAELSREFGDDQPPSLGMVAALEKIGATTLGFWNQLPDRLTLSVQEKKKAEAEPLTVEALRGKLDKSLQGSASDSVREWLGRDRTASQLAREKRITDLEELCRGLWYGVTGMDTEHLKLPELMQALSLAQTGGSYLGGLSAFREYLLTLARRLGAHAPEKEVCRRIFIEEGRFVGVQITHRGRVISAGGGVLGCSLTHAREKISASGKTWKRKFKDSPAADGWKFTLALTVHAEAIPPGMSSRVIWKEPGAPVLEVEIAHPEAYGMADSQHRLVFVRTLMPFTQESLDMGYQRMIAARMFKQLTEIMPFVEYHVTRIYPDFRNDSLEMSEVFGFASPHLIPDNIRCINGQGVGSRSGIDGLFVASGESFPELGSLGAVVAALEGTAWLAHRSGLVGPLA